MKPRLRFAAHAAARMAERGIEPAWVEAVLSAPARQQADPLDPALTRSFGEVAEAGGRVLRVVPRPDGRDTLVVTALFDPGACR